MLHIVHTLLSDAGEKRREKIGTGNLERKDRQHLWGRIYKILDNLDDDCIMFNATESYIY